MNLLTQIPLEKKSENLIGYHSNVLLLGSCFSENIGDKFGYFKFQSMVNPFGILFQPKAIEKLIYNAVYKKEYIKEGIFFHNEQWHCFDAHSKLSSVSKEVLLQDLNAQIESTYQYINKSTHIVITLGTAWVYKHIQTEIIVANCHKIPQKQFSKELLSVEEIIESLENIKSLIKKVNPKAVLIFTVSPVRHVKDGFIENTQSKSHLITAIHQFIKQNSSIKNLQSFYFPSYEIMMDELRDYRFYNEDMVHPNQTAINYIWKKFQKTWISLESFKTMDEVEVVQKGLQHRPFNSSSEAHKAFLKNLAAKQLQLQSQFPYMVF